MSASKAAAAAAGRTLLKAGSRSIPAAARGGGAGRRGSKVARGLASVSLNQQQQQQSSQSRGTHGAMLAGASACAALVGVAALLEAEDLEGMLPAFLSERLQQQASPKALARIEEFYDVESSKTLGRGQFGTVCKATDKFTGEVVAVKCVPRTMASEAHFREEADVHREAASHPNVVGMKGAFADEDCWYMVMQLADGGELYDRLTTEGFALDDGEIRSLLRDAADALGFLHDRSIVHGDVKPENLLLTASDATAAAAAATSSGGNQAAAAAVAELREEAERRGGGDDEAVAEASEGGGEGEGAAGAVGKVLLADFGSSFRMRGDGGRSGMKTVKEYTVAYSAPEVVDHSPEISAKADVWSLGVIAYVMVKGHHPFDPTSDADDEEISENILYSDPDWDGVEPKAATLIRQMLARDPQDRPSAREVLQNSWLQQLQ